MQMFGKYTHSEKSPSNNAWASLLGLLSISEYFVTVDHSVLWYRHIAWAKPHGEELRTYVTQRFASNMVVLSLMLGAQINVFFSGSVELTQMRRMLATEAYGDLKFWIAIFIALDAFVTIMALVATFTLWGMIGAISDSNSHALIRSSIGQYVISMPPRLVVAALYLFIFWLLLAFLDLMSGPSRIILAVVVFILFFHVIVPLSAFGRLIVHTGAMAKRRVLEEEFEKELLPSGLHASLLIRATGQRRKYTSTISQYKKIPETRIPVSFDSSSPASIDHATTMEDDRRRNGYVQEIKEQSSSQKVDLAIQNDSGGDEMDLNKRFLDDPTHSHDANMRSHERRSSEDAAFPRPSVLNAVRSSDLRGMILRALSESERGDEEFEYSMRSLLSNERSVDPRANGTTENKLSLLDDDDFVHENDSVSKLPSKATKRGRRSDRMSTTSLRGHQTSYTRRPTKRDSRIVLAEWAAESSVRDLYNEAPASIFDPTEANKSSDSHEPIDDDDEDLLSNTASSTKRPGASVLNRKWRLQVLPETPSRDNEAPFVDDEGPVNEDPELGERQKLLDDPSSRNYSTG